MNHTNSDTAGIRPANQEKEAMSVDEMIKEIEENSDVLYSYVPDSRVHELISNPYDEGIAEG